jgi:tetratricopeptide (TPR) repeat protein
LFSNKKYTEAKSSYNKALNLKPNEQYPKDKISEIEDILANLKKQEQIENQYKTLITKADKQFNTKKYSEAKQLYQQASKIKPSEEYPKTRLKEISDILLAQAETKKKEQEYKTAISLADKFLAGKQYESAKQKYEEALRLKPGEQYPKDKLSEISNIESALAAKKAKDEQYQSAITSADKLLTAKQYESAKQKYQEALSIKPKEQYPKNKINEIDNILAEISSQKAKESQYKELLSTADKLFSNKKYTEAKSSYNKALNLKPNEQYPKDKIAEIEAKKKAIEERRLRYKTLVSKADKLFAAKDYKGAKGTYNAALNLMPDEQYPKNKISEIEKLLASASTTAAVTKPKPAPKPKLKDLKFKSAAERQKYLSDLAKKYPDLKPESITKKPTEKK